MFLLSGEQSSIPEAEARSTIQAYDPEAKIEMPEERVLLALTCADPDRIASRVAFTRRVGELVANGELSIDQRRTVERGTFRVTAFDLYGGRETATAIDSVAGQVDARVSLRTPDREITVVRGRKEYLCLSRPGLMRQGWVERKPRSRAFFHPAAIFPKLSRALVNLSGVREGETFLDPFSGTGSLLLEADEIGAMAVGLDIDRTMTRGGWKNMRRFGQDWLGVVRADSNHMPLTGIDAIATDVPYGRASSTSGNQTGDLIESLLKSSAALIPEGRKVIVMHPRAVPVVTSPAFRLEEEHHIYIHRKLTRTVSVLRRV